MHKKCPGFFEQKSLKTGKFGYQMQKNPQCPKTGEILGTGEKSPGSCPNGPGPDGISMSADPGEILETPPSWRPPTGAFSAY